MAERTEGVSDTGFTLVHEPKGDAPAPVVDIVIVHGLQGHPFTTWACPKPKPEPKVANPQSTLVSATAPTSTREPAKKRSLRTRILGQIRKPKSKSAASAKTAASEETIPVEEPTPLQDAIPPREAIPLQPVSQSRVFWPRDMLPIDCPRSRILVYGYDSKVTKYMRAPTNKNSILSHGRDLLFALSRVRKLNRPLVLVAHSLGGIVVKEMLAQSSTATADSLNNIVDSTSSVIFLGTPHRGSPDFAAAGEWARNVVETLRMETNDAILAALSLKTTDLERAQEAFSTIWLKHDFRVKTFQEGLGLTGVRLSVFGNKVVPDHSSLIGDARERAETIQANHRDMCRFTGPDDPNYTKLAGELITVYDSLISLDDRNAHNEGHIRRLPNSIVGIQVAPPETGDHRNLTFTESQISVLKRLSYPSMNDRKHSVERPAMQTCGWLFEQHPYQDWLQNRNQDKYGGLLWLKGKPGAGKSTLMNEAVRRAETEQGKQGYHTASFFFNAKGVGLEHSPLGLFRSLLYQLIPHFPNHLPRLVDLLASNQDGVGVGDRTPALMESDLRQLLMSMFGDQPETRVIIFIDALDECDPDGIRSQAYLWRDITRSAPELSVCLSSRHFPTVTVKDCRDIIVDRNNHPDIVRYVDQRLSLIEDDDGPEKSVLKMKILERSAGVFLWVTLAMDNILEKWDEGEGIKSLLEGLDRIPGELETLFASILKTVPPMLYGRTIRLFQWAILATRPLRLYEWEHIIGFTQDDSPLSLKEWRASGEFFGNSAQAEKRIRSLSKGLIEVSSSNAEDQGVGGSGISSGYAGAGSLEFGEGGNRIVQVIHESVREFFLQQHHFPLLGQRSGSSFTSSGHLSIMATCINYINIDELDDLVQARRRRNARPDVAGQSKAPSVHSFGSAYSHRSSQRAVSARTPSSGGSNQEIMSLRDTRVPKDSSAFEKLKRSIDAAWDPERNAEAMWIRDAPEKMASIGPGTVSSHALSMATGTSSVQLSLVNKARVLEDYPALLLYCVSEMFTHARLAQNAGADPERIISKFQDTPRYDSQWTRWLALAEHIPHGTGLLFHVADQGLSSWVTKMAEIDKLVFSDGRDQIDDVKLYGLGDTIVEAARKESFSVFDFIVRHSQTNRYSWSSSYKHESRMKNPHVLHQLARKADVLWIRTFLSYTIDKSLLNSASNQDLNVRDRNGQTALHIAVGRQNHDVVAELLKYRANIETEDSEFRTPLHFACMFTPTRQEDAQEKHNASFKIVKLLLESSASVFANDPAQQTPLHIACESLNLRHESSYETIKLLLESGAPVNSSNKWGHTVLYNLCYNNTIPKQETHTASDEPVGQGGEETKPNHVIKIIDLLLQHGAGIHGTDSNGRTVLHIACASNSLVVIRRLLAAGADLTAIDYDDKTPIHIAATFSSENIAAELIRQGASVTAQDAQSQTPLDLATFNPWPWPIFGRDPDSQAHTSRASSIG